jgi:hypothetical protein
MDPLARLFGSSARLKLLRLFVFNDDLVLPVATIAERAKIAKDVARKELTQLAAIGVVRKRTGKGASGYQANKKFVHYGPLASFMRATTDISDFDIQETLKKAGTLRLVVLTGMFTGVIESKVDLLVVGDKLEERPLLSAIHSLEAELGREIRFASFSTEQFRYRLGVYDRLLRDVFDYPYRSVLDKLGVTIKSS